MIIRKIYVPFNVRLSPSFVNSVKTYRKLGKNLFLVREPSQIIAEIDRVFGKGKPLEFLGRGGLYLCVVEKIADKERLTGLPTNYRYYLHPSIVNFLLACDLIKSFFFTFDIQFGVDVTDDGKLLLSFFTRGWYMHPTLNMYPTLNKELPFFEEVDIRKAKNLYQKIVGVSSNSQFRRLQRALKFYTQTLFTNHKELIFVMYWQSLEALFSLEDREVTHQLCERIACVLRPPGQKRKEIYHKLKELYAIRSRIVHGGDISEEEIAKNLKELADISRNVLKKILKSRELLNLYKQKDSKKLRKYFITKLFSK